MEILNVHVPPFNGDRLIDDGICSLIGMKSTCSFWMALTACWQRESALDSVSTKHSFSTPFIWIEFNRFCADRMNLVHSQKELVGTIIEFGVVHLSCITGVRTFVSELLTRKVKSKVLINFRRIACRDRLVGALVKDILPNDKFHIWQVLMTCRSKVGHIREGITENIQQVSPLTRRSLY